MSNLANSAAMSKPRDDVGAWARRTLGAVAILIAALVFLAGSTILEGQETKKAGAGEADKGDRIKPGDRLNIRAKGVFADNPIDGIFSVERGGRVALGPGYGRVLITGLTFEEAESAIQKHLAEQLKEPRVSVTRYDPVTQGGCCDVHRRVHQLEEEVRALQAAVEKLTQRQRK